MYDGVQKNYSQIVAMSLWFGDICQITVKRIAPVVCLS